MTSVFVARFFAAQWSAVDGCQQAEDLLGKVDRYLNSTILSCVNFWGRNYVKSAAPPIFLRRHARVSSLPAAITAISLAKLNYQSTWIKGFHADPCSSVVTPLTCAVNTPPGRPPMVPHNPCITPPRGDQKLRRGELPSSSPRPFLQQTANEGGGRESIFLSWAAAPD